MARLYYGGYGHRPDPTKKQYVYWGGDNYRNGQNVVAPVTNWRSGKTYNTMFTILSSKGEQTEGAQNEAIALEGQGIAIKSIGGTDVLTLPGGQEYSTKAEWARAKESQYRTMTNPRVRFRTNFQPAPRGGSAIRTTFLRRFR